MRERAVRVRFGLPDPDLRNPVGPVYLLLANPRGFCAGVERAIRTVERALDLFGPPIFVRHEIVHNRHVVEGLRARGVRFVEELDEVPDGAVVIYSAHGVPRSVWNEGARRDLRVVDATCPLVTKVHRETQRYAREGREQILIGHAGHPEVVGTMGQIDEPIHLVSTAEDVEALSVVNPDRLAFVTQTTLSVDETAEIVAALRRRFPKIIGPRQEDTCYATRNRQKAVTAMLKDIELLLVVGAQNSSNSRRLRELGTRNGIPSHLINDAGEIRDAWLQNVTRIGITAGASAPEHLVREVLEHLRSRADELSVRDVMVTRENVQFSLPI